ncbi:19890_t:CDS:2 [Dentiscutata erythropus]|uniref:19890_t:CDS:1 n=1 Tax=Dentiscutata erythropus TaxID=1348616 RepID=A0A9N9DRY6_9GLOM|nr:19890_t:CDS:2 [Dentiscutata erythropus]
MWKRWGTEYVALKTLNEGFSYLMHEVTNTLQTWFDCTDDYIQLQFKTADEIMQKRPLPISYIHPSAIFTSRRLPTVSTEDNYQTRQFDLTVPDEDDKELN